MWALVELAASAKLHDKDEVVERLEAVVVFDDEGVVDRRSAAPQACSSLAKCRVAGARVRRICMLGGAELVFMGKQGRHSCCRTSRSLNTRLTRLRCSISRFFST